MKIVECVPNFSEGRNKEKIDAIRNAAQSVGGVTILDCESDPNHNRTVLTFIGTPEAVLAGALASASKAVELIDLTNHTGEHPRMGAVDVVPFVPLRGVSMDDCVALAKQFAIQFSSKCSVPVYLYERAATREERRNLANVREGQFEGLRELIGKDPSKDPDYGPRKIHPTAGATAVGARPVLIAYNVDLKTEDLSIAKNIARKVRERDGGFPAVKALGFELKDRKLVQVSMNLTDYTKTSMHTVFDAISSYAKEQGVEVADSEIVGLVPQEALVKAAMNYLRLRNFNSNQIIENRLISKGNDTSELSFKDMALEEFVDDIASPNPVPGGGSACAYAGALAASLVAMVCRLTIGKKNYEQAWKTATDILEDALRRKATLMDLVLRDAMAFEQVSSAMKLPKATDEERARRRQVLVEALKLATEVPSETIQQSFKVLELAKSISKIGNKNARSDGESAIELAKAAMKGAWSNVQLNLESLSDDGSYAISIRDKLMPLLESLND